MHIQLCHITIHWICCNKPVCSISNFATLPITGYAYRIEQNFGGKKIWRNCGFETLAEKTLANPRLACIFVLHQECWRKKLGELWRFAKFAKVFSPPKFCSIRYPTLLHYQPLDMHIQLCHITNHWICCDKPVAAYPVYYNRSMSF